MKKKSIKTSLLFVPLLLLVLVTESCTPGSVVTGPRGKVLAIVANQASIQRDAEIQFTVSGTGACSIYQVYWGDGTFDVEGTDFAATPITVLAHKYTGWGGTKTITAEGVNNCDGSAHTSVTVDPSVWREAVMVSSPMGVPQTSPGCYQEPKMPILRQNSVVTITTNPNVAVDFGCFAGGCVYGIDGKPDSVASSDYPFPGLREYSLVIKLGPQIVQGGTNVTFTAQQTGRIELCLNDNDPSGNSGAWGVFLEVTEPAK